MIADLDILINGFEQLDVEASTQRLHSDLIQAVDRILTAKNSEEGNVLVGLKRAKRKISRGDQKALWSYVQQCHKEYRDNNNHEDLSVLIDAFEVFLSELEGGVKRLDVLKDHSETNILSQKRRLLADLRRQGIFILEKGCLDDYYPKSVTPTSIKPERAHNFCKQIKTRAEIVDLCEKIPHQGLDKPEWEIILETIFSSIK